MSFTENPPVARDLRKRKRYEENEEAHQKLFKSDNSNLENIETGSGVDQDIEVSSSSSSSGSDSDTDNESPADKFRRGGDLPSDLDMGSNIGSDASTSDDQDDGGDWHLMGAALEREFLGSD